VVQRHLHRLLSELLREHLQRHRGATGSDADLAAEFYTGAALAMLTWWVDHNFRPSPQQVAGTYQRLAARGLAAVSAAGPR
jgi:hypothetical protein